MCKQTYHHFPGCGHIANWTVESCIEFTNTLRDMLMGQMMSCPKIQQTHDLLPLTHPTFCYQCEREWRKEFTEKGTLRNHPTLGDGNVSLEGLGSTLPVIEVNVKSALGIPVDDVLTKAQPTVHEVEAVNLNQSPGKQTYLEDDWILAIPNPPNNLFLNPRTPPFPPPRVDRIFRQQARLRFARRKNPPKPIVTEAPQREYSSFDPFTPSSGRTYTIPETCSSPGSQPILPSNESPILKPCSVDNWIPVPPFNTPASSSCSTSKSFYSVDEEDNLLSSASPEKSSPLCPLLSRPEEYKSCSMSPENKGNGVEYPLHSYTNAFLGGSFANGCICRVVGDMDSVVSMACRLCLVFHA